ncbi:MAG TPA: carbohydrate kinase family protein [Microvirga sp.]|nr:carbohydrate kinase family protein [Microvirga sp.]
MSEPVTSQVICIGGAAVDRKYHARQPIVPETSNPVSSERSFGGVARNVAENLSRLRVPCSLVSLVGQDENGRAMLQHLAQLGIDSRHVHVSEEHVTAEYVAVLQPSGDLAVGLADMAIFDAFGPVRLQEIWPDLPSSAWLFADCNLPADTLHALLDLSRRQSRLLAVDAVSTAKAMRLPGDLRGVGLLFLNRDEARALTGRSLPPAEAASALLRRGAARIVLTCGPDGVVVADASGVATLPSGTVRIVDATGAGDALIAASLTGLMRGLPLADAARLGMLAARLTLEHHASVRPDLSLSLLEAAATPVFEREAHDL